MPRVPKDPIPVPLRWQVWERDDFRCHYCGARSPLAVDHKVPESKGGTLALDNLVTACVPCNSRKGTRDYEDFLLVKEMEWAFGYLVMTQGSVSNSKETWLRMYQLATVNLLMKQRPGWYSIRKPNPKTGNLDEYWQSVKDMTVLDFIEHVCDRKRRELHAEAARLTAHAVERFGPRIKPVLFEFMGI